MHLSLSAQDGGVECSNKDAEKASTDACSIHEDPPEIIPRPIGQKGWDSFYELFLFSFKDT